MTRTNRLEILDSKKIDPKALHQNLSDISQLNRLSGTIATLIAAFEKLICFERSRRLVVLDVGTGAGDLPRALLEWSRSQPVQLTTIAGDIHGTVLAYAKRYSSAALWLQLDAVCLPFADRAVDVAIAAQMAHHLEPAALQELLSEMQRVSRVGFILMDLKRGNLAYIAIWFLTRLLSNNPLTRHDGPLSAQRAYTSDEVERIAETVGIALKVRSVFPFRWIATWERSIKSANGEVT